MHLMILDFDSIGRFDLRDDSDKLNGIEQLKQIVIQTEAARVRFREDPLRQVLLQFFF